MAAPSLTAASRLGPAIRKRSFKVILGTAFWGAILFTSAGRIDWWRAWVELGLFAAAMVVGGFVVVRKNPEVIAHRGMKHDGTKRFDKIISLLYVSLTIAVAVVAGLDAVRFGHSTGMLSLYVGVAFFLAGNVPMFWAMLVNPFLETTVRIQTERGHRVISVGPYRFVRHPMYVGIILQNIAAPLVFGSRWAFVPAGCSIVLFIVRTALEDRTLRRELAGYEEFAHRTRYRLFAGIW